MHIVIKTVGSYFNGFFIRNPESNISGSLRKFGSTWTDGTNLSTFVLHKMYGIALHYFINFCFSGSKIRIRKCHGKERFFLNRMIPITWKSIEYTRVKIRFCTHHQNQCNSYGHFMGA